MNVICDVCGNSLEYEERNFIPGSNEYSLLIKPCSKCLSEYDTTNEKLENEIYKLEEEVEDLSIDNEKLLNEIGKLEEENKEIKENNGSLSRQIDKINDAQ
jgi:predicted RNase H-like nuclease (RuvC/YqgF family)